MKTLLGGIAHCARVACQCVVGEKSCVVSFFSPLNKALSVITNQLEERKNPVELNSNTSSYFEDKLLTEPNVFPSNKF